MTAAIVLLYHIISEACQAMWTEIERRRDGGKVQSRERGGLTSNWHPQTGKMTSTKLKRNSLM